MISVTWYSLNLMRQISCLNLII